MAKNDEKKKEEKEPSKLVKIKVFKHMGTYSPDGEHKGVYEVTPEQAKAMCHVNELSDGISVTKNVRAMLLEDAEELDLKNKNINNLTAAQAAALGVKNVIDSSPAGKADEEAQKVIDALKEQNEKAKQ